MYRYRRASWSTRAKLRYNEQFTYLYPCLTIDLHVRTAYEPPPEFPLASPYSGIVHYLSGPSHYVRTQTSLKRSKSVVCAKQKDPNCYFHYAYRFATRILAYEFDSLVRVSRRVE